MTFDQKLDGLLTQLDCPLAQVARHAGLDPSLLSRFRRGKRIPTHNSPALRRLCHALALAAGQTGKTAQLAQACGAAESDSAALEEKLYIWFTAPDSRLRPARRAYGSRAPVKLRHTRPPLSAFGEKLDMLMHIFSISNIQLARWLNVDGSLISRYRTGARIPSSRNGLVERICEYFSRQAPTPQQQLTLQLLLELSDGPFSASLLQKRLYQWFLLPKQGDAVDSIDVFLQRLDSFSNPPGKILPASLPTESLPTQSAIYQGVAGLRQAVLHFLQGIAAADRPRTIYLYSDQAMQWLTGDEAYLRQWSALMFQVLSLGCHIHIIHNIDRDDSEMLRALESWIPLYMTAQIHPYFCQKARSPRFFRTLFVAEDLACLHNSCVAGTEAYAPFYLVLDRPGITYGKTQFEALLAGCLPLMQIFSRQSWASYLPCQQALCQAAGPWMSLHPGLSPVTLPAEVLARMLTRQGIPCPRRAEILQYHRSLQAAFLAALAREGAAEYVVLPTAGQAVTQTLPLPDALLEQPLRYTAQDYTQHMEHTIALLKQYPSYTLCPLPAHSFSHIHILHRKDAGTLIVKDRIWTAFLVEHPLVCRAFDTYFSRLAAISLNLAAGKADVLAFLEQSLSTFARE